MGQKIRPTGLRVGVMEGWSSRWYAPKQHFSDLLIEDFQIRRFVKKECGSAGITKIEIERTQSELKIILHTAKPGVIIGRKGEDVEKLQKSLEDLTGRRINVKIEEVGRPEIDAQLISESVSEQLRKRTSFRRALKRALEETMKAGARGVKIQLSGRLGGAEMSRVEKAIAGSVPLNTLQAKISYGFTEAATPQGNIGIKVWVNQGFYREEERGDGAHAKAGQVPQKPPGSRAR